MGRVRLSVLAAIATTGIVPFTILMMQGTNERLFALERAERAQQVEKPENEKREVGAASGDGGGDDGGRKGQTREVQPETREMVRKWARLNLVRAMFPAFGAGFGAFAAG